MPRYPNQPIPKKIIASSRKNRKFQRGPQARYFFGSALILAFKACKDLRIRAINRIVTTKAIRAIPAQTSSREAMLAYSNVNINEALLHPAHDLSRL
jgi:hypothetical protein